MTKFTFSGISPYQILAQTTLPGGEYTTADLSTTKPRPIKIPSTTDVKMPRTVYDYQHSIDPWDYKTNVTTISYWDYPIKWNLDVGITFPDSWWSSWIPADYQAVRVIMQMNVTCEHIKAGSMTWDWIIPTFDELLTTTVWLVRDCYDSGSIITCTWIVAGYLAKKSGCNVGWSWHFTEKQWDTGTALNLTARYRVLAYFDQVNLQIKNDDPTDDELSDEESASCDSLSSWITDSYPTLVDEN